METRETIEPWVELESKEVFAKYGRRVIRKIFRLPNGETTDFYLNDSHDYVACLALTADEQVILVRQFRPGPASIVLDIPGGRINPDETPEKAAGRELLEETGYVGKLKYVGGHAPGGITTYKKLGFVATECEKVRAPQPELNGEQMEVVLVSLPEFREHLRSGIISDVGVGYLGLDFLKKL